MDTEEQTEQAEHTESAGPGPDESRADILSALADIEAAIQQAEATQGQIADAADGMRQSVHGEIEALEKRGPRSEEEEQRYRDLLADRRRCDVVGAHNQEGL